MSAPDVTVLVITFRGRELLPRCLDSLAAQTQAHELLVVDNASMDGTADFLAGRLTADQVLRLPSNAGFAGGVAAGLGRVRTRFVALLNDDAEAAPDWLEALRQQAISEDPVNRATAAWTSLLVRSDDPSLVQNAGVGLLDNGYGIDLLAGEPADSVTATEVFGFSGGAALLRTEALRAAGGFPAEFFLYYEDTDTSWRLRRSGWSIRRVPESVVRHDHSATADQQSGLFHQYNERNRLLTLTRNAPATMVLSGITRFALTTASLAVKRLLRKQVPADANFRIRLRIGVLCSWAARLPRLLRDRAAITRRSSVPARGIRQRWTEHS